MADQTAPTKRARQPRLPDVFESNWQKVKKCIPSTRRRLEEEPHLGPQVAQLILDGASFRAAMMAVGIPWDTATDWIGKGKEGQMPFKEFYDDMLLAKARRQARTEILHQQLIEGTRKGDAKAIEWVLEKTDPETYAPPKAPDQTNNLTATLIQLLQLNPALALSLANAKEEK